MRNRVPRVRPELVAHMSEADLQRAIIDAARTFGWLVHHGRPSRTNRGEWVTAIIGDRGFPDLVLVKPPRIIMAELKSSKGRMGQGQPEWGRALEGCPGVEYYLWRPADLSDAYRTICR